MRRLSFLLIIGLFLSIPSFAQEVIYPKAEIFGGFSISSSSISSTDPLTGLTASLRESFMGWQGSVNGNLTHHLAIVGDFGGQYKTIAGIPMNSYQFLFGPRIMFRAPRITPFVHAMFGGVKEGVGSFSFTDPLSGVSISTPGVSANFSAGLFSEFLRPLDPSRHLHHHEQRQNRPNRYRQACKPFKEKRIRKQHKINQLRQSGID